jgi:hypothetical protein
VLKSGFE